MDTPALIAKAKSLMEHAATEGPYFYDGSEVVPGLVAAIEWLETAITVRNNDVRAMFERAQAVEAFVEDMHAVGRLRLTPEWQERMDRVMRFRKREMHPQK